MTPEERAAFIVGQAAILNAEVAGMVAENQHRMNCGNSIAFGVHAFQAVIEKSILWRELKRLDEVT